MTKCIFLCRKKYLFLFVFLISISPGCDRKVPDAQPVLPLSTADGIEHIFTNNNLNSVNLAITNAFSENKYRGMFLTPAKPFGCLVNNWKPTNGLVLLPIIGPITNILLDTGYYAPYRPYFYITVTPLGRDKSKVTVRTVLATITDGKELGIHGGWAYRERHISPIRKEEENVMSEIISRLKPSDIPSQKNANANY